MKKTTKATETTTKTMSRKEQRAKAAEAQKRLRAEAAARVREDEGDDGRAEDDEPEADEDENEGEVEECVEEEAEPTTKKAKAPKAEKPAKADGKREGNIDAMSRMLVAGESEAAITAFFTARYSAQGVAHKTGEWIDGRVAIYRKIAMRDAAVKAAVEAHAKKPAKGKKKASK